MKAAVLPAVALNWLCKHTHRDAGLLRYAGK